MTSVPEQRKGECRHGVNLGAECHYCWDEDNEPNPDRPGEQERQTELVIWRCPECERMVDSPARTSCWHRYDLLERIPVIPTSAVEELVRAGNALYGQIRGYRGYGAHSTGVMSHWKAVVAAHHPTQKGNENG